MEGRDEDEIFREKIISSEVKLELDSFGGKFRLFIVDAKKMGGTSESHVGVKRR